MLNRIESNLEVIKDLCKMHYVKSFALFGSAAKNITHSKSDIDFLVEFNENINVLDYADNYFSFLEKLENIFKKEIDLISMKSLKNPIFKDEVYNSKIDLYAA